MSVIGMQLSLATPHPQGLIDALYKEYFDLHPAGSEVDVALVLERQGDDDSNHSPDVIVRAVKLFRVSDPDEKGEFRFAAFEDKDYPISMLRGIIDWGRSEGAAEDNRLVFWVHKHPEGMAYASEKDEMLHAQLISIDWALGDRKHRVYGGGAVVTRPASEPLNVGDVSPATFGLDIEIDGLVAAQMVRHWAEGNDLADTDPILVDADRLARLARQLGEQQRTTGDYDPGLAAETIALAASIGKTLAARQAAKHADEAPKLRAKLLESGMPQALVDQLFPAEPRPQQPGPLPLPGNPLSLPQFQLGAADNVEPQIGFRPPTDKDRLN